jgi:hypothetical protein
MTNTVLEIEADSLQSARQQAKAQVPAGLYMLSETILCDGKESRVKAVADSASAALEKARKEVPEGAEIVSEKELVPASHKSIEVEAFDEQAATSLAKQKIDSTARIEGIMVKTAGSKGFLGMGKKPSLYQVTVFQPSVAEARFRRKAKIRVQIGEIPASAHCQMCGRANSPAEKSEKSVHFFCSPSCRDNYYKAKVGALLFGPRTFIVNASGQDISGMMASGQAMAARARSYCWSCGASVRMTEDRCGSCGVEQEIKL